MENKSEYGIYEEFLKNFDSVNYKNKDSSIINNEFQKVISELCEKDMINVALQAELDRQVFLIFLKNCLSLSPRINVLSLSEAL